MRDTNDIIEDNYDEDQQKSGDKKSWVIILLLIFILAAIVGGGIFLYNHFSTKSQFDMDREALEGWLPGKSDEDIQSELNRIIDESRFNVAINPSTVVSQDGTANFLIENVPANNYWMQVTVLYQDLDGEYKNLYESKYIQQGRYIESGEVSHIPTPGEYDGIAVFKAIIPDSDEVMGETQATMKIYVEE